MSRFRVSGDPYGCGSQGALTRVMPISLVLWGQVKTVMLKSSAEKYLAVGLDPVFDNRV